MSPYRNFNLRTPRIVRYRKSIEECFVVCLTVSMCHICIIYGYTYLVIDCSWLLGERRQRIRRERKQSTRNPAILRNGGILLEDPASLLALRISLLAIVKHRHRRERGERDHGLTATHPLPLLSGQMVSVELSRGSQ